jgi:hypothetical protein
MLFLLRPRQTYMPYALPRSQMQQQAYDQQIHEAAYTSTRRVTPYEPNASPSGTENLIADLKDLGDMHESGSLSDAEFAAAKARLLAAPDRT